MSNTYVPVRNTGAQITLHAMLTALAVAGEEVKVVATADAEVEPYRLDGLEVSTSNDHAEFVELAAWADVVVAQLDALRPARVACAQAGVPLVHVVHTNDAKTRSLLRHPVEMVVYVSEWLRRELRASAAARQHVVVPPPVDPDRYATERGDHLTLINLSLAKGVDIFYALASRLSHRRFLGVLGGHEPQVVDAPSGVTIVANAREVRERVYARTRVLLMPSRQESFGRVALEAAASGIPTIAAPVEGLREALGGCAAFVRTRDVDDWAEAVETMLDPIVYRSYSERALTRCTELWRSSQSALSSWRDRLHSLRS
jgi:glycosyltransferase involved in cell wall biosynthesis